MSVELKPHQEDAIAKMKNGCILYGDVGVGKTITSLGYYVTRVANGEINKWGSMQTPKDVYVITTAKVRDGGGFDMTALKYGISSNRENSTNGVKITVDSWNKIEDYVGVKDAFFIFDEQRVVGYGKWSRSFIKIARNNEWILLSGTPGDTWLDYIPVFIANGWYKHKTDFLEQHVIWTPRVRYPKVLRYQNAGLLVRRRNEVLVHMPYKKHTVRHGHELKCDFNVELFDKVVKKRWHVYENRPLRDAGELFSVMRKVVNSNSSRVETVQRLLEKHPKLIVFYNFDYELEMLRTLIPSDSGDPNHQNPSESSITSERPNTELSTMSSSSQTTCPGHWTEDLGMGEEFYHCSIPNLDPCLKKSEGKRLLSGSEFAKKPTKSGSDTAKTFLTSPQTSSESWEWILSDEGKKANLDAIGRKTCQSLSTTSDSTLYKTELSNLGVLEEMPEQSLKLSEDCQNSAEHRLEGSSISSDTLPMEKSYVTATKTSEPTFSVAEWNGHKHEAIPATERWVYLVQYRAGAEGWDCVDTNAICFFSQTYSYRDWIQAHGRTDRLNTPFTDLHYYYLLSDSAIDKAIKKALKTKKNFNERDLVL